MKATKLPKEQKEHMIRLIQQHFEEERGETIGELAADSMLDFFLTSLSPYIYNQALSDCRTLVNQRMVSMEDDIYALEQKIPLSR
ncbi:DUF2164 domain-containing protein [Paenibacillus shunpengii]|uniref:DUF2164 domain-containing protein n=1 Tax=Paenibacillus shunpengii TaxID=2054424 RepID=A0ABW5SUG9_9BACL|nr:MULTISPECIES: DUF2164 domain-containing protein [unclassified Paenibacillus]OMC66446.1 hypothetical protein BK126_20790 [Paenibacillus sp. FSL H7-0326]SDW85917.1 Uncharacterized conserved protein, DUF2164 family [Paenibacillus sp. PDC88]